ncbi:MAG: endopeptidase La, partial [Chloroflexota bacterium]|nr:endopeptidase La [Chloroflexota bacterium]
VMVFRPIFQRAVDEAMAGDRQIVVVGRRNREERDFTPEDLYTVGTLATVNRVMRLPDGTASVVLEGFRRVSIESVMETDPFYRGSVLALEESSKETMEAEATRRAVLELLGEAIKTSHHLGEEDYIAALNAASSGEVADQVANSLQLPVEEAQAVLELLDPDERLEHVHRLLARELEVLRLQNRMQSAVQEEVEKTQREHILREHLRMIQDQLKDVDPTHKEANDLNTRIEQAGMPEAVKDKALEEMNRLSMIPSMSPESSVLRNYLDWLVSLPWSASTEDNLDTVHAAKVLDKNHYGLRNVKERLLEFMAVRKLSAGKLRSPVLCLVGPPGVGKTSLGRSIAEALGRVFVRVSLGGVRDEAEVRGHRRTYVGALPGRIVQAMKTAGVVNPVFMLDELDKMGSDFRGDPSSALLEVLDPEQNHAFSDHYLEVPYDLSKVLFIATANVLDPVIPALRDRLEVLELPGYTEDEKIHIAKQFLAPKQSEENGLGDRRVPWSEEPLLHLIRGYTHEAGVRNLEREIGGVYRKVAKTVADGGKPPSRITTNYLTKAIGPVKYTWGAAEEQDEIGVATGVARTAVGGDVLSVEVSVVDGKGDLTLTGSLGDVMKESAQAALSYARARSHSFKLPPKVFEENNIHIHVPSGAVPKDGPSAGVTLATALVSALGRLPVRKDVAMTGEVTLRGRVLEVGGIKEKVLAAHRAGIKTFVLPKKNNRDLEDVPSQVRRTLNFVPVENMDEVLAVALLPAMRAEG